MLMLMRINSRRSILKWKRRTGYPSKIGEETTLRVWWKLENLTKNRYKTWKEHRTLLFFTRKNNKWIYNLRECTFANLFWDGIVWQFISRFKVIGLGLLSIEYCFPLSRIAQIIIGLHNDEKYFKIHLPYPVYMFSFDFQILEIRCSHSVEKYSNSYFPASMGSVVHLFFDSMQSETLLGRVYKM